MEGHLYFNIDISRVRVVSVTRKAQIVVMWRITWTMNGGVGGRGWAESRKENDKPALRDKVHSQSNPNS